MYLWNHQSNQDNEHINYPSRVSSFFTPSIKMTEATTPFQSQKIGCISQNSKWVHKVKTDSWCHACQQSLPLWCWVLIPFSLSHSPVEGHLFVCLFLVLSITNKTHVNIHVRALNEHVLPVLLTKTPLRYLILKKF